MLASKFVKGTISKMRDNSASSSNDDPEATPASTGGSTAIDPYAIDPDAEPAAVKSDEPVVLYRDEIAMLRDQLNKLGTDLQRIESKLDKILSLAPDASSEPSAESQPSKAVAARGEETDEPFVWRVHESEDEDSGAASPTSGRKADRKKMRDHAGNLPAVLTTVRENIRNH